MRVEMNFRTSARSQPVGFSLGMTIEFTLASPIEIQP